MHFMQSDWWKERELTIQRDNLEKQRQQLDEQISRLSQPDGSKKMLAWMCFPETVWWCV